MRACTFCFVGRLSIVVLPSVRVLLIGQTVRMEIAICVRVVDLAVPLSDSTGYAYDLHRPALIQRKHYNILSALRSELRTCLFSLNFGVADHEADFLLY